MQQTELNIVNPMPKTKLARFRYRQGVFVVRNADKVLYVGWSADIYTTAMRYFGKRGVLKHYDPRKVSFEVVVCSNRKARTLCKLLKYKLMPEHNTIHTPPRLNRYEKKQANRLLNFYLENSMHERMAGEHKTDK